MSLSVKQTLFISLMQDFALPVVWNVLNTQGEQQAFQSLRDLSSVCERLARVASSFDVEGGEFGQNWKTLRVGPTVPAFERVDAGPIKRNEGHMPDGMVRFEQLPPNAKIIPVPELFTEPLRDEVPAPPVVNTPHIVRQTTKPTTPNVPEDRMPTPAEMAAYNRACQTAMLELSRMGNNLGISKEDADKMLANWMPRHERERMEGTRKVAYPAEPLPNTMD